MQSNPTRTMTVSWLSGTFCIPFYSWIAKIQLWWHSKRIITSRHCVDSIDCRILSIFTPFLDFFDIIYLLLIFYPFSDLLLCNTLLFTILSFTVFTVIVSRWDLTLKKSSFQRVCWESWMRELISPFEGWTLTGAEKCGAILSARYKPQAIGVQKTLLNAYWMKTYILSNHFIT